MAISPELLQRLKKAGDPYREQERDCLTRLLRRYPTGRLPALGINMCIEFLLVELPPHREEELHWLDCVEVHPDDREWSLNGVPQGGVLELIKWIAGPSDNYSPPWSTALEWWYKNVVELVQQELARRLAAAESMEGAGI